METILQTSHWWYFLRDFEFQKVLALGGLIFGWYNQYIFKRVRLFEARRLDEREFRASQFGNPAIK
jgi:hypothetical protein